jgi:hypothetical protein
MLRKAIEEKRVRGKVAEAIKEAPSAVAIEALEEWTKTLLERESPAVLARGSPITPCGEGTMNPVGKGHLSPEGTLTLQGGEEVSMISNTSQCN